ncbi:MAG: cupin domain-containing protein [Solirubrobacteraceae bacterium]
MPPLTVNAHVVDASSAPAGDGDALRERPTVGPTTDFPPLEQTIIELDPGASANRETGPSEEVLFVLNGTGSLELHGDDHDLEPESGAYLAPGEEYRLENSGPHPLTLISVRIPDPDPEPSPDATDNRTVVRRLADQESQAATTDREFRIVADPATGLRSATHFVGYIPTARAPDHFHTYNEVIYMLDGEGVLHAQGNDWRLGAGSCIQLPARVVHCLENTGDSMMRVVAVFRPAGSPAAAYYPDGTPAHPGAPPIST